MDNLTKVPAGVTTAPTNETAASIGRHSRLPWRVEEEGPRARVYVLSSDDYYVCTLNMAPSDWDDDVTEDDNAAFIVRATNAHWRMLEALKAAQRALEVGDVDALPLIHAAIAEAEK